MKTKILLLMAATALIVYSCSADREEEVQNPIFQKMDIETEKTNSNRSETSKVSDSIDLPDHQFSSPPDTGLDPNPDPDDPQNPNDPGAPLPIIDPTKPHKPW